MYVGAHSCMRNANWFLLRAEVNQLVAFVIVLLTNKLLM